MIRKRDRTSNPWSPDGYDGFATHYPATRWAAVESALDRGGDFLALWRAGGATRVPGDVAVLLTPGLFAEWLPGCFAEAGRALRAAGHRVSRSPVRSSRSIAQQAAVLCDKTLSWLRPGERFIWCAHSKGALDALWALHTQPELRARCLCAVLVQPPVGHSWILDRWMREPQSPAQHLMRRVLRTGPLRRGCAEITRDRDPAVARWLSSFEPPVPTLNVVSWSVEATSWVDSHHRQLNVLRPGWAHDGQFYLDDQRLPATPVIGLPRLDHAQPVLGGLGLDVGRFWSTLLELAWIEART